MYFLQIYYFVIFGRIILSWFMMGPSGNRTLIRIYRVLYGLTEPILAPLRRIIPTVKFGMGYLDLSPLVLLILVMLAQQVVERYL